MTEDSKERVAREIIELLNEIRVPRGGDRPRRGRRHPFTEGWAALLGALIAARVVIVWYEVPLVQRRRAVE